jgi:hypothetical protein
MQNSALRRANLSAVHLLNRRFTSTVRNVFGTLVGTETASYNCYITSKEMNNA